MLDYGIHPRPSPPGTGSLDTLSYLDSLDSFLRDGPRSTLSRVLFYGSPNLLARDFSPRAFSTKGVTYGRASLAPTSDLYPV